MKNINEEKKFNQILLALNDINPFKNKRLTRLEASVKSYRIELDEKKQIMMKDGLVSSWLQEAETLLHQVELSLGNKEVDQGWIYLHKAKREKIYGMEKDELLNKKISLVKECNDKIRNWRHKAINEILNKINVNQDIQDTRNKIYEATELRDDCYDNEYHKIDLKKIQLISLCYIIFPTLVSIAIIFWRIPTLLFEKSLSSDWRIISAVLLFGLLGGSVSALLSIAKTPMRSRTPDLIANFLVTLVRTLIGAAAALIIFLLLYAGIINFNFENTTAIILIFSFIAGFSERFFKNAIESISGKEKES